MVSSTFITIDPGVHGCGVALFKDGKLDDAWYSATPVRNVFTSVLFRISPPTDSIVIIEKMRIYPGVTSKNLNSLIDVSLVCGAICQAFYDYKTFLIPATYWKGSVKKEIMTRRIELLAESRGEENLVEKRVKSIQHNIWDAVGMGYWAHNYMRGNVLFSNCESEKI